MAVNMAVTKTCTSCKVEKSLSEFYKSKVNKDGFSCICSSCLRERNMANYHKKNKENPDFQKERYKRYKENYAHRDRDKVKNSWLKRRYGITLDDYNYMLQEQEGQCAICGKKQIESLYVDHSHITGEVRGLLCHKCNSVLGYVNDDVNILAKSINYLERITYECNV